MAWLTWSDKPASQLAQGAEELGFGGDGIADLGDGGELRRAAAGAALVDLDGEGVAGRHGALEARAVDADEVVDPLAVVLVAEALQRQHRGGLRHRLHDEHSRHHRVMREVPGKERLVHRY